MANVSKGKFEKLNVLGPPEHFIGEFHLYAQPMFDEIRTLLYVNSNLRQTRDFLLPQLISGKIDVSDLDIDTGAADE